MRVLSIIGTRPEALKLGPVVCALSATPNVESLVCATGQHRKLLQSALSLFGLRADFNLTLRRNGPSPNALVAPLLVRLGALVDRVKPDWIIAVGDTTSVLCASLTAVHHHVRFAHVEAGLRTDSKWEPFPEEANRRIASVLADLHLAPTAGARQNLLRENITASHIVVTGNPIIDTLHRFSRQPAPAPLTRLWRQLGQDGKIIQTPRLIVATFHRRENIGVPMQEICTALRELARIYGDRIRILCLVHPNPAVRRLVRRELAGISSIVLSEPLDYRTMLAVLQRAHLVLTDSGGLQEEAPSLRIPTLVLRNRTERPEGVCSGVVTLVGTARTRIVAATRRLLDEPAVHRRMSRGFAGYGDGHAAEKIVRALLKAH